MKDLVKLKSQDAMSIFIHFNSTDRDRLVYPSQCSFGMIKGIKNRSVNPVSDIIPYSYIRIEKTTPSLIWKDNNWYYYKIYPIGGTGYSLNFQTFKTIIDNNGENDCWVTIQFAKSSTSNDYFFSIAKLKAMYCRPKINEIINNNLYFLIVDRELPEGGILSIFFQKGESIHSCNASYLSGDQTSVIQLSENSSSIDDYYNGWTVSIPFADYRNYIQQFTSYFGTVVDYDGSTKQLTILRDQNCKAITPAIDSSFPIFCSLSNAISDSFNYQQPNAISKCDGYYNVRLLSLTLPDLPLKPPMPRSLKSLAGIYVHIGNSTNGQNQKIVNNNSTGFFFIPLNDLLPTSGMKFFNLKDCYAKTKMKLDLNQPLYIQITDNDGKILSFIDDNLPPLPPDRFSQISAVFQLQKIESK